MYVYVYIPFIKSHLLLLFLLQGVFSVVFTGGAGVLAADGLRGHGVCAGQAGERGSGAGPAAERAGALAFRSKSLIFILNRI